MLASVPLFLEYEAVLNRPEHLAAAGLDSIEPRERDEAWLKLKARLDLARGPGEVDEAALEARIDADPKDFEARFALAPCTLCGTYFAPSKLVALVDKAQGNPLTQRIRGVRQVISDGNGVLLPGVWIVTAKACCC